MQRLLTLMLIGLSITAISQTENNRFNISFKAATGISIIHNSATVNMNHLYGGSPVRSIPKMSYEIGTAFHYSFEKTNLEIGVNYSNIQSLHKENTMGYSAELEYSNSIRIENVRNVGYINFPIMLNREYKSFSIGGGLQSQFAVNVKEEKKMWTGPKSFDKTVDPILNRRTIKTFDIGFVGQASFFATEKIALNCKFYWGLANINNFQEKGVNYEFYQVEKPVIDRRLKSRQLLIGIQYHLF